MCEDLADDVVDAAAEVGAHRLKLFEQALEELSLDGVGCAEVEDDAAVLLADAVDASHPLLEPDGVPGQVVVDHQVAELQVDPFPCRLRRDADLSLLVKKLLDALALDRWQAAVDRACGVAPVAEVAFEVVERVAVLGEDQELAAAVA